MRALRCACAAAVMAAAMPASAQSIGEVAQKEQARRATAKAATKSYSNADLKPGEIVAPASPASPDSPASPASCFMSVTEGRCVSPEELIANSSKRFPSEEVQKAEPDWRREAANLRTQIEKTQAEIDVLSRVVANEDRSAGDRRAAGESLAKLERLLGSLRGRWESLEKRATDMRVPLAWLAPVPVFAAPRQ